MSRPFRASAVAAIALAFAVLLTACAAPSPDPTPRPTPTADTTRPTPSAEPSAAPADPLETVTGVVIRPDSLELRDEGGALITTLDYLADPGEAVATLARVFGSAPENEEVSGNNHFPPATAHRWGAFELWENRYVDRWAEVGAQPRSLFRPNFGAIATGPSFGDVQLTTVEGIQAGSPWQALLETPGLMTNPSGCSGPYLDASEFSVPDVMPGEDPFVVSVDFVASQDESVVDRVRAPMPVLNGCA